jgi:class 3 adenylate cyclase/tetratricopeptide (TPR) repeat protein
MNRLPTAAPTTLAGHRRHLTVLFADLSGSTRMGEQMEAEDFAELLGHFRTVCRTVIAKHGGLVARTQGDGVLALFGNEGAREDDGRRAVEAALELTEALRQLRDTAHLGIHSGVHAGHCFVEQGDVERGRVDVLGDVPNVAAGLASLAGAGEVCVSAETLGPLAHFFEMRPQRVLQVKGRQQRLTVCTVVGHAGARTRFEAGAARGLSPFVGRSRELGVLQARLRSALNGSPHTLVIVGAPGVGKTRLLDELARDAAGECKVLRGFCESYLSADLLQPFLQIVRTLLEEPEPAPDSAVAEARRLLRSAADALGSGRSASGAATLVATLRDAFDRLASAFPLLLLIDDWQWADDGSVQVLEALRTLERPIFILLATREASPDELAAVPAEHMRLDPLSRDAAALSVRHLVPGADPFLVDDIYRDSGGNPLFLEELCHSAAHTVARDAERSYGGATWLASLIEARVSRLSPEDARVVRAASVIGNVVDLRLLSRVVEAEVGEAQLHALSRQDFLHPTEQAAVVRFKHGITREVTYAGVGLRERVAIHVAVAKAMEAVPGAAEHPEALAYHYARGQLPMQAARHAEAAGDKAMAAHALDRARLQYVAALDALDQVFVPDRGFLLHWCAVAERLGMACVFDALAVTDATRLLARAVEIARQSGEPAAIARAEYWLAYICYAKGRGREASRHCQVALEVAGSLGDERLMAQLLATRGQISASLARYEESIPLLDTAIDRKRARGRPGSGVAVGSVFALAIKGSALGDQGRFDLAEECFAEMMRLLEGSTHQIVSSVRNWIGVVYLWQGRWADALAVVEESMQVAQNVRSHLLLAFGKAVWGYAQWRLGGTVAAGLAVRDATQWVETRGGALGASLHYGWLLDIGEGRGADEQRRRNAALLMQRAREHDLLGVAMGARALARAAAKARDRAATERYFVLAERAAERRRSPHEQAVNQLCLAEIRLLQERPREALAPLDAACRTFSALSMGWHLDQGERLRARL